MNIWLKRFACWITKATNAHLEYVILLVLPRQKFLRETTPVYSLYVCALALLLKIDSTSQDHTILLFALLMVFQYHPCEHIRRHSINYRY